MLQSSSLTDFSVPRLRTKFGERAFTCAGQSAWKTLPDDLRVVSDPGPFRKQLKTHFSVWILMSIDYVMHLYPIVVIVMMMMVMVMVMVMVMMVMVMVVVMVMMSL